MDKPTCDTLDCDRPTQAKGMCTTHYSTWYRANRKRPRTCEWCEETFHTARTEEKFCSRSCAGKNANSHVAASPLWAEYQERIRASKTRVAIRDRPRVWLGTSTRGASWVSGPCPHCSRQFTAREGASYCSERCRQRAKEMRRYRVRGEFAVPDSLRSAIYARDHHMCQICTAPVDPGLHYTHPMSATLDHIVPQSHGGSHEEANLRLAHRRCNSQRGDRVEAA